MAESTGRKPWLLVLAALAAAPVWADGDPGKPGGLALLLAAGAGMTAFVVWGRASFPELARKADKAVAGNSTWRSFWVGAINAAVLFLLAVLFGRLAQGAKPFALLLLATVATAAALAFRGGLGLWPYYGHRILAGEAAPTDLNATLAGGALLTGLSLLFPVGLLFLGYALIRSIGAGVLTLVSPKPAAGGGAAEPAPGGASGSTTGAAGSA